MSDFKQRLKEHSTLVSQMATLEERGVIEEAIALLCSALSCGLPVLICGNGGSASDALHISGELVGTFLRERKALNVICLNANVSVLTAWTNDYEFDSVFSRQVEAHGQSGGVCWGISTSGNSQNVVRAMQVAQKLGLQTLGLTGQGGGKMAQCCDILIDVPSTVTPRIQELHLLLYHYICEEIEARLC
ncbi:D-sedoheptulose-7-phosphate isomerase [Spirulina sp. 06S082]|uniref:D-sedoheptulose-7-phosphate isomerase n=1 Tax=Spirulina sp. 06S082 TaxID=3110248 RepID=UPI002B1F3CB5|nr:SIS domain-containing protein [Spirulina sp. 06S082]MEA5468541.1 SIS domain-containing protein [Spirulina sp. 06S082]